MSIERVKVETRGGEHERSLATKEIRVGINLSQGMKKKFCQPERGAVEQKDRTNEGERTSIQKTVCERF